MKVVQQNCEAEIEVRGSRFLAQIIPIKGQEEARATLRVQKERYADATHVVHAFISGNSGEVHGCSDDGEPSGTAGRPVLEVLKGSGLTNVLCTVTRWFGGTLLGTGGLVKAYTEAAKAVSQLAIGEAEELVELQKFSVILPYDVYERFTRELDEYEARITASEFTEAVSLNGMVPAARAKALFDRVVDISSGRAQCRLIGDARSAIDS